MPVPAIIGGVMALGTVITVLQTVVTVVLLVVGVFQAVAGFDMSLSFATDIKGPAAALVDSMYSTLTGFLPFSINGLLDSIDSTLQTSSTSGVFTPAMTLRGLFNTIAFSETFNTCLMCFLNGLLFVLNVRFLRWSIQRLGLRFRGGRL